MLEPLIGLVWGAENIGVAHIHDIELAISREPTALLAGRET